MIKDCIEENKRQVPLIRVVKSAIIDVYGNISELQELYSHWAARGLKKLQYETLKTGRTKVLIKVNQNTKTATLPLDFGEEIFVGYINNRGEKVPLKLNPKLIDGCNIEMIDVEDKCTSCGQDKTICEDLAVTEDVELVVINGDTYENKVIKKLYPNGDYYIEKHIWLLNIEDDSVSENVTKDFVTNFGLKPCGCLDTSDSNLEKLRNFCYDTYCCHYAPCCTNVSDHGYAIFEDNGLIQFDFRFPYPYIYMEYLGYMPKKNGQYMVPEVAFETLVEWTKWRAIKDKKGVERWRIHDQEDYYTAARKTMNKMLSRISLFDIISALRNTPKFNLDYECSWYSCFNPNLESLLSGTSGGSSSSGGSGGSGGSTTVINNPTTIINNASYQLAVKTGNGIGHPVDGESAYQNNVLKGATDLNIIFLARQTLTKGDGDFSFDPVTGIITLLSTTFVNGDTLIIPYNKKS